MLLEPVAAIPPDFRSSAQSLTIGPVSLVELHCGPSMGRWQREGMDAADQIRVAQFYRADGARGSWQGREGPVVDGWPVVIGRSGGCWVAPAGFRTIQVNVARSALPFSDAALDRICERGLPPSSPVFEGVVGPMLRAAVGRLDGFAAHAPDLGAVWLAAVTLLLRSIDHGGDAGSGAEVAPARRVQALRYIEAHLDDPALCPELVAAALHVSRRSLYEAFAADGGVAGVIRQRRLERARRLLADPAHTGLSVAEVGAAVGIGNAAHFSRLFRAAHGEAPREARARARLTATESISR